MNFTAVRGFNAYAQFSATIRQAVMSRDEPPEEPEIEQDSSLSESIYSEPVDVVAISDNARKASTTLVAMRERNPQAELSEWKRTSGVLKGRFSREIPGSIMNEALSGSNISVDDDEEYTIDLAMRGRVNVSGRNAEKARAIQNLLNTTPSNINWGLLLMKLPPI